MPNPDPDVLVWRRPLIIHSTPLTQCQLNCSQALIIPIRTGSIQFCHVGGNFPVSLFCKHQSFSSWPLKRYFSPWPLKKSCSSWPLKKTFPICQQQDTAPAERFFRPQKFRFSIKFTNHTPSKLQATLPEAQGTQGIVFLT